MSATPVRLHSPDRIWRELLCELEELTPLPTRDAAGEPFDAGFAARGREEDLRESIAHALRLLADHIEAGGDPPYPVR